MSDPIDSAVEGAESASKAGTRGPRDRFYFCAAAKGKNVVHETVNATSEEEAKELFMENHGLEATVCDTGLKGQGYYIAKGTGQSDAQRISVTVSAKQLISRTPESYTGEFKGWNVYASGLKGFSDDNGDYDDNELVSIEFDERIVSDSKVPKPKLKKREVVRLNDLDNVASLEA